jgi:hypothetical protein
VVKGWLEGSSVSFFVSSGENGEMAFQSLNSAKKSRIEE